MNNSTYESQSVITSKDQSIVYFDGVCGLCNSSVDFLLTKDKHDRLLFAPLQGETAAARLSVEERNLDSIVFQQGRRSWQRSSAIVRILLQLPQPWKFLGGCLWMVPKPIRDLGYKVIARLRYRLFGKHETCRMPTEDDRAKLLA